MRWPLEIFFVYVIVGPAAWAIFAFMLYKGHKRMLIIKRPPEALPQPAPRATILIPAKDEGERISGCLESAVQQDYPDFEVIAVNDRSTDRTGEVMEKLAARDARMRVVHIRDGELPAGWTGKNNALNRAVAEATGQWLLFVDSDVVLERDALSCAISCAIARRAGLLSMFPRLESHTIWESLVVPLAGWAMSMLYLVSMTNEDQWPGSFANGQFMLFSREAYEAVGGHASVKDKFCEDIDFARLVKPTGRRVRIAWGSEFAAVRMYSSMNSIVRGFGRIFFAASVGRPWRIILGLLALIVTGSSGYIALVAGIVHHNQDWTIAAMIHLIVMSITLAAMYRISGNPRRNAMLFPLGAVLLGRIFIKALHMCATGKLEWRGTRYSRGIAKPQAAD